MQRKSVHREMSQRRSKRSPKLPTTLAEAARISARQLCLSDIYPRIDRRHLDDLLGSLMQCVLTISADEC